MKIKNRLYISAGISIALVIILSSLVFVTSGRIAEENKKHALLDDVRTGISGLDIVAYEYLLHHEKRMEQQWNLKYNSLREILGQTAAEGIELPESMRADYASVGDLFSQVTTNNERIQKLIQEGASQQEIDIATGLEERLVSQLLITSHSLITEASGLAEEAHTEVMEAQRRTARLALIFMIILAITVPTLLFRVIRNISRPLDELTKGTRIIGKGDLKHRVEVKSKDELGELATAFNQMTENLFQDTIKRKRAEHSLTERVKELQCLYGVANLAQRPKITLDDLYQEVANLLPQGWQYPDITCARIAINGKEFRTNNYRDTQWKLSSDIKVSGAKAGVVEICYLEERPVINEGPFVREERLLLDAIATRLGLITEQKQAQDALKESQEFSRSLITSMQDGLSVLDPNGVHIDVNHALCEMTGFSREELIGVGPPHPYWAPEDYKRIEKAFEKTLKGKFGTFELTFIRKNGERFPVLISPSWIKDKQGNIVSYFATTKDITELKRMEEQLIVTDRLASIGELASGIAHELNNPLTGVIGFSELLLEKDVPDDVKEDLKVINREAQRTAGVVRNLLTFARKHPEIKEPLDINSSIEKVLALRTYEQRVNNVEVNTQFASDLPELMANGFDLQQVFLNIIINAEHFMIEAHGKGTLTITTERVDDIIRASIADDGPGIAKENLGHLFDPFFTTKEVGKGTGLGLSISYGIITEHGGRIYAESEPGKGATFVVELPVPTSGKGGTKNENS